MPFANILNFFEVDSAETLSRQQNYITICLTMLKFHVKKKSVTSFQPYQADEMGNYDADITVDVGVNVKLILLNCSPWRRDISETTRVLRLMPRNKLFSLEVI